MSSPTHSHFAYRYSNFTYRMPSRFTWGNHATGWLRRGDNVVAALVLLTCLANFCHGEVSLLQVRIAQESLVMQNLKMGVCYEGSADYIRTCIRHGPWHMQPDADFVYGRLSKGGCKERGYPVSLKKYSSVIYKTGSV